MRLTLNIYIKLSLLTVYQNYFCSSLTLKRKDSDLDVERERDSQSTLGLDAVEDKVLTVTLIPTLELSSQQRFVQLSQGIRDVGVFSAGDTHVQANTATSPF